GGINFFEIASEAQSDSKSERFVSSHAYMRPAGWTLYVITPASKARTLTYTVILFTALGLAVLALIVGLVWYRRKKLIENIDAQQRVQQELELRVEQRTQDLQSANQNLKLEVQERTQAEQRLRQTQRELVQAGKLAALGKMAASLSHEINQPLAAIRAYAGNANTFIERGNIKQAGENIGHIETMADRMGGLIGHLKNFARKPKEAVGEVDLNAVLIAVETIMSPEMKNKNATLLLNMSDSPIPVRGGLVRLQQVFVNLINNGLDAMSGQDAPHIEVNVEHTDDNQVLVTVRDFGDGIDAALAEKIFDPFFTTKEVNEGLGLGLSISYNIIQDCDGELSCANHPEKGAIFTIRLESAMSQQLAAE
ncbi:MAG: ATP-binding protein, partial [Hyphomicrobiales bacterium]